MPAPTLEAPASSPPPRPRIGQEPSFQSQRTVAQQRIGEDAKGESVFAGALLEANAMRRPKRAADYALSLIIHSGLIAVFLLLPLYFTQSLNLNQLTSIFLVAPPPPPPAPPAAAHLRSTEKPAFISNGKLYAPEIIPKKIAMIKETPQAADAGVVIGGVPGGVPGGQVGGVLGGILSGIPKGVLPPAPAPAVPIRVGGDVKRPRAIYAPDPAYPVIARIARIEGDVVIDSTIDQQGNVIGMKVVSGQKLLIPAALAALKQWRFEPTYLNGQAVAVEFHITIQFQLTN